MCWILTVPHKRTHVMLAHLVGEAVELLRSGGGLVEVGHQDWPFGSHPVVRHHVNSHHFPACLGD